MWLHRGGTCRFLSKLSWVPVRQYQGPDRFPGPGSGFEEPEFGAGFGPLVSSGAASNQGRFLEDAGLAVRCPARDPGLCGSDISQLVRLP